MDNSVGMYGMLEPLCYQRDYKALYSLCCHPLQSVTGVANIA